MVTNVDDLEHVRYRCKITRDDSQIVCGAALLSCHGGLDPTIIWAVILMLTQIAEFQS